MCGDTVEPVLWGAFLEGFFGEYGCVVAGGPERRWYQESWGVVMRLERTNLAPSRYDDRETPSKLQAICLLHMYLGIYQQGSGELDGYSDGPSHLSWIVDALRIGRPDLLRALYAAGLVGAGDVRALLLECDPDHSIYLRDAELWLAEEMEGVLRQEHVINVLQDALTERFGWDVIEELIRVDNDLIYHAICEHYGGATGLFASIWNSRLELEYTESVDATVNSNMGEGKLTVWPYVEGGMRDWRAETSGS